MHCLNYSQKLPISLEECWDFFSSPANLKTLTPLHLGFEITNDLQDKKMYPGQIIAYTIRPLWNMPMEWVTEITHVEEQNYFIDEQRIGPYKMWHHEHRFTPIPNGTEMVDTIYYQLPLGPLGKAIHTFKVEQEIKAIFAYRQEKLETLFGRYF